jgi:UDP-N-acetylglucosamine:LPS N-acetylglucosamine transferase
MKLLTNKVVGISSSGGHLSELQSAIPNSITDRIVYIISRDARGQKSLSNSKIYFIVDPNGLIMKYFINLVKACVLFLQIRPSVIISTGSGIAVPFILIGKLLGSKIIFIESGARIYTTSKTGRFVYKYADVFYVQYDTLLKFYPKAILGSLL